MKKFALSLALLGLIALPAMAETDTTVADTPQAVDQVPLYPRVAESEDGWVVIHEPQIESWEDFERVTGRVAVEATLAGETDAVLGTAEFAADTEANVEERVVAIDNPEITGVSFPGADGARLARLQELVRDSVREKSQYVPLDVVLSYVAFDIVPPAEEGLSFEPPTIFYSSTPAILLMTDGEPILAPIKDTRLEFTVNTNWDLFRYKEKEWYLRHGRRWLKAKDLKGSWKFDSSLPGDFKKLPDDDNWTEVKASVPPSKGSQDLPTVFVSDRPAELIVTDGEPSLSTITAGGLEYVRDTESDLFRLDGRYFYLVSGRWFESASLKGPWHYVRELPEEFSGIPPESPKGHVLAAVPGSEEAQLAVLEAQIPRKASVSRDAGEGVSVVYQGDPEFVPIEGTDVQRVLNSPNDVLLYEGVYYLCLDAVWYRANESTGPWVVADDIPAAIYAIPPSSPVYHVTHVKVYDSDSDTVSTGYTSGYYGTYVSYGVVVYGSGWYYPPYYGYGGYYGYPYSYYPYPYSYGASAWYNPNTGTYGRSVSAYGPYGGYGRGSAYNPKTGTYARGEAVWDSNEIAGRGVAYNPRTGTGVATHRYANEDGGWGESLITQNDKWMETRSEWSDNKITTDIRTSEGTTGQLTRERSGDAVTGTGEFQRGDQTLSTQSYRGSEGSAVGYETGSGQTGGFARSSEGDLYAGRDGEVYKRDDGGWQQRGDDGSWNPVEPSEDRAARTEQARSNTSERRSGMEGRDTSGSSQRRQSTDAWSNRTYDTARSRGSYDSQRRSQLDRSYNSRTNGNSRYNQRRSANRSMQSRPSGGRMRGRRR